MNLHFLSDYYPLLDGEGHEALCRNGNLVQGYRLLLPERYSMGAAAYASWILHWERALAGMPAGSLVLLQDVYTKNKFSGDKLPQKSTLQQATAAYFDKRTYIQRESYVFFVEGSHRFLKANRLENPLLRLPEATHIERTLEQQQSFRMAVQQAVGVLHAEGQVHLKPLNLFDLGYYTEQYFNAFETESRLPAEMLDNGRVFRIGAEDVRTAYVGKLSQLPSEIGFTARGARGIAPYALPLSFELPFDHVVNLLLSFPAIEKEKAALQRKRELFHATRKFSRQNEVYLAEMDAYLDELAKDGGLRPVRMHLNLSYRTPRAEDEASREKVLTAFRKMDIQPKEGIGVNARGFYWNSYFGHVTGIPAHLSMPLTLPQALCFMQPEGNYHAGEQGIYFNERLFNLPVQLDLWNATKAKNFFIMAPTGGGKSFLAAHLVRQWFEAAYRIVIVDLGGSYQKLCSLLEELEPGSTRYIEYQVGAPLGLNPFAIEAGQKVPSTEKLLELTAFLLRLWKRGEEVDTSVEVSLRKLLSSYYSKASHASLQDFYDYVATGDKELLEELDIPSAFFPLEEFLHNTGEFIGTGPYGYLFRDGGMLEGISKQQLVVFELDAAKDDPLLVSILTQAIGQAIRRLIWQDRSQKGVVFFDEFAKMLTFPGVLASVEYYYQAIRKQEAAVGVALQSPNQLPEGKTAAGIIDNTPVLFALPSERGYGETARRFDLSEHALRQLESLKNNFHLPPHYTEFFLQLGKRSNTYRLEVPEMLRLAYLTDGAENAKLMEAAAKEGSLLDALEKKAGKQLAGEQPLLSTLDIAL